MMKVLEPSEIQEYDVDSVAIRVFLKALEIIGGPRKLIEFRNLTWLPSLMSASYAVVLLHESAKTEDEIAQFLGIARNTVRNILRADPELVKQRLSGELETPKKTLKAHTAGGLAKLAYQEIKEGRDYLELFSHYIQTTSEIYGVFWPVEVLRRIKGLDFPITVEQLLERAADISIEDKKLSELRERLPKEIKSPSQLLKAIKEALG
ncbi:hypothetical protein HRbin37_01524 [bacterium HR37]|jgi:probable regulatory domain-containing protein|nr:hypothetical protein HRbin37_01524 [bacterium HR37]